MSSKYLSHFFSGYGQKAPPYLLSRLEFTYSMYPVICLCLLLTACTDQKDKPLMQVNTPKKINDNFPAVHLSKNVLYDKILGSLVGSAIGDAMGAPTEMWSRDDIQLEYGYIDSLDDMIREPSPEGTWDYNLAGGSTTDDTRWKLFMSKFMLIQSDILSTAEGPTAQSLAKYIVTQYEKEVGQIKKIDAFEPSPLEEQMRRIAWLQEWAMVAKPLADNDLIEYINSSHKFYGGDMACAGLLYSPIIGMTYPGATNTAYQVAHNLALFDLGYAKDITSLTAAMVAEAMRPSANSESILNVNRDIDPENYFKSRLLGRVTYRIYKDALTINKNARIKDEDKESISYPEIVQKAYKALDAKNQDVSFHAGEIHLINLTAMLISDFDFRKAIEFVINYGRDNDTVAAVTGSILGAFHGFDKLPMDLKQKVLSVNKNNLGIDLEDIATKYTDQLIQQNIVAIK